MQNYKDFYTPGAILLGALIIGGAILSQGETTSLGQKSVGTGSLVPPPVVTGGKVEFTITENDHIRGNSNAPVTIVEFSDLECPFCKRFHATMQQVLVEYGDKVRWVYKHFPIDQLHSKADKEAEAAECAGELGGNDTFWEYMDRIFEITPSNNGLDLALLGQTAEELGLDRAVFQICLDSGKYAEHVEADYQQGIVAGVTGTPGSFVNGIPVKGAVPYEQLKSIIEGEL